MKCTLLTGCLGKRTDLFDPVEEVLLLDLHESERARHDGLGPEEVVEVDGWRVGERRSEAG